MTEEPPCPKCGSAEGVTWQRREGGTGPSEDVWQCSRCGEEFTTTAR